LSGPSHWRGTGDLTPSVRRIAKMRLLSRVPSAGGPSAWEFPGRLLLRRRAASGWAPAVPDLFRQPV